MSVTIQYYGEHQCEAVYGSGKKKNEQCNNKAYYEYDGKLLCGQHTKGYKERKDLPKNPNKNAIRTEKIHDHQASVDEAQKRNQANGVRGDVIVRKMRMMQAVEDVPSYLKVFPNFKHGNRKDGFGCSSLSPMSLGPIHHIMPGIPPANTIEAWHQQSKAYPCDVDENGDPTPEFKAKRIKEFESTEPPRRHKYDTKDLKKMAGEENDNTKPTGKGGVNINKPLYSVFYNKDGEEHRFSYFGSRYFYCKAYERLAPLQKEFALLRQMLDDGINLQICGYDGYPVTESLLDHYYDTDRPFGHELVLYTLLTVDDPRNYPWNITYENNKDMYEGVGLE